MGFVLNFQRSKRKGLAAFLGEIEPSDDLSAYSQILIAARLGKNFRLFVGYLIMYFVHWVKGHGSARIHGSTMVHVLEELWVGDDIKGDLITFIFTCYSWNSRFHSWSSSPLLFSEVVTVSISLLFPFLNGFPNVPKQTVQKLLHSLVQLTSNQPATVFLWIKVLWIMSHE